MSATISPVDVADRVAMSMTELNTATRALDDPADALWILGSIQAASISLMLTLQNLSAALQNTVATVDGGAGMTASGRVEALRAAERLEAAARGHTGVFAALVTASESLGRVDWDPDAPAEPSDCRPVTTVIPLRRNAEIHADAIGPTL